MSDKAAALASILGQRLRAARSPEAIIVCNGPESALQRRVRNHYETLPYHAYPPTEPLGTRLDKLHQDWAHWVLPIKLEGQRTMDVGCGCGFNLALHGALAAVAVGIDCSLAALRQAQAYLDAQNLPQGPFLIWGDICYLDLPDRSFDVITCVGVLHHIPDHPAALANMARLLERSGVLLLGVYHPGGRRMHRFKRRIVQMLAHDVSSQALWARRLYNVRSEAARHHVPLDMYLHDSYSVPVEKAFSVQQLIPTLQQAGLTPIQVRPSPSIGWDASIEPYASVALPGTYPASRIDPALLDRELKRLGRHHYWCLAQKV